MKYERSRPASEKDIGRLENRGGSEKNKSGQ